jgi:hypothetical protein
VDGNFEVAIRFRGQFVRVAERFDRDKREGDPTERTRLEQEK